MYIYTYSKNVDNDYIYFKLQEEQKAIRDSDL